MLLSGALREITRWGSMPVKKIFPPHAPIGPYPNMTGLSYPPNGSILRIFQAVVLQNIGQ